jgi:transcriptional regulator with XRE-family HTH domain
MEQSVALDRIRWWSSVGSPTIERVLAQQGRTMSWLARKTGVSVSYAWLMLRGKRPLTDEFRARSAEALGVPEDILFPVAPAERAS